MWCDAIIVQAVAESQNLRIHIVESNENFSDTTLIEPAHLLQQSPTTIYLGHVNEEHMYQQYHICVALVH